MRKDADNDALCLGKDAMTRQQAQRVAQRVHRKHTARGVGPYKCRVCRRWHVGTRVKDRQH